ncbi:hypothetical protein NCAS_0E03260 [Naumovozyma castellii]|uniref:Purine-cytosine permease n=1 Tax=Naumovozyma castellii TaxID=27288 RepID=G0VFX7_NAUCA|nr:hypothetical protein NCAS_0E03260 [Naumovozyma castellii CBS 4309]CCC70396.1 hypothetical protein NCAS_0E03260 [Naumovozyma castellii CBS 4309]
MDKLFSSFKTTDLEKQDPAFVANEAISNDTTSEDDFSKTVSSEASNIAFLQKIATRLNAETRGIEPVRDDEKTDANIWNPCMLWFSANFVISAYAVGALGPMVFGLNFGITSLTIVFFNIIGVVPVAYFSLFGPGLGLRQMVLSRYLVGNIVGRFFSFINCIACVGWCVLNSICSAQLLNMVNLHGHRCPFWAGIMVVVLGTILVTFFGIKVITAFERWSWVPNLAVFLVIIARLHKSGQFSGGKWTSGPTTAGNVLSLGCVAYGYAGAWATYSADYTVYMPRNTNKVKLFFGLCVALTVPLCFTMILGAAVGMGGVNNATWAKYYSSNGIGGLTYEVLVPNSVHGFGEFCCVLLALSTIANNTPNMYTLGFSFQAIWEPLARVPRAFCTLFGNAAVFVVGCCACYYFDSFMEKFMDTLAYYGAIYISLGMAEHLIFRKCSFKAYDVKDWKTFSKLPIGIAGGVGFFVAAFGVALGMCQSYWVGEIGRRIGKDGGDVGFEMGAAWGFIAYVLVRPLELKYFGR